LDQLVSNKVDDLTAGTGKEALLLTPKGRITMTMRILCLAEEKMLLDTDPGRNQELADFFAQRVFATKVQISDLTEADCLLRVLGAPGLSDVQELLGVRRIPAEDCGIEFLPWAPAAEPGDAGFITSISRPSKGFDIWAPCGLRETLLARLLPSGYKLLTAQQYEDRRVCGGLPLYGRDFDDGFLPQEAALERAVHYKKGCYLGQEAVAMAQRGRIKRRLRHFEFEEAGRTGEIFSGQEAVGAVTSVGQTGDCGFGIGVVKTSVSAGEWVEVVAGGKALARAKVTELPGTEYGPRVPSARELRESLKPL